MKKKGLIISTVVMAVILIASLTTATYAWFSATAQASVDSLQVNTTAAEGLQIAMTNVDNSVDDIVSGDLEYDAFSGKWTGSSQTWGTMLGLSSVNETVGTISDAITWLDGSTEVQVANGFKAASTLDDFDATLKYFEFTQVDSNVEANLGSYYELSDSIMIKSTEYNESKDYYTIDGVEATSEDYDEYYIYNMVTDTPAAGYYVPTGYDSNVQPTGYILATPNDNYYLLKMAVTNLVDIYELGMSIEVTPSGTANFGDVSKTAPGMTAASRVLFTVQKSGEAAKQQTIAPFSAWKLATNNIWSNTTSTNGYNATKDGASNADGKYAFIIDGSEAATTKIDANTIYYITALIWVEGTDGECSNNTTGTSMAFQINFSYTKTTGTPITWTTMFSDTTAPTPVAFGA